MTGFLDDQTVTEMLVAVGADPAITPVDFDTTFEDLDLDSLARAEFAAQIKQRIGVGVDEQVHDDSTPNSVRRLVASALAKA